MSALVCIGIVIGVPLLVWLGMIVTDLALSGDDEEEL